MSILIKGMEMPKNCDDCPLNYDSIDCMVADIALREKGGGDFLYEHERASKCPLVPVPPHGRLVDMDEIEERIDSCCDDIDCSKTMCNECAVQIVMNKVFDAPTIIPAEEGET